MRNASNVSQMDPSGHSPRKTLFIMVTVVGCIAILWPKVFYPMMFGSPIKSNPMKDYRSGTEKSCCEVILDKDTFFNASVGVPEFGPYRKHINLYTGEISLRQERPPHLRPESIHPAMRERGRAIPAAPTIPIVERAKPQSSPARVVEGRPGPIPGMRPPLGAGSVHQATQKTSSMGFIMPLYTIGIVAFFIYTIMKILFKKPMPNAPYTTSREDPSFHKEVFGHEKSCCSGTKLGWKEHETIVTAIQGLLDAADEQLKNRENSTNSTKDTSENIHQQNANGHANPIQSSKTVVNSSQDKLSENQQKETADDEISNHHHHDHHHQQQQKQHYKDNFDSEKQLDDHLEKSVVVLGMELTASCEGGRKWNRPPTPVFIQHNEHSIVDDEKTDKPDPELIYLEGALPHESKILVADSKTEKQNIIDEEFNGSTEEPAVVLSSKMTLSLINLDVDENKHDQLDHEIEIINGKDKEIKKEAASKENEDDDDI